MFFEASEQTFAVIYVAFFALIVLSFFVVRPRAISHVRARMRFETVKGRRRQTGKEAGKFRASSAGDGLAQFKNTNRKLTFPNILAVQSTV